jgi:hypothetical protein
MQYVAVIATGVREPVNDFVLTDKYGWLAP